MHTKNHTASIVLSLFLLFLFSAIGAEEVIHVLQKGETLYGVSRKYHVPADAILSWNDLNDPDKLQAGQKLRIPGVYTIQKGDTLYGIARKLSVPVETLIKTNNLSKDASIKVGGTLYIPSSSPINPTVLTTTTATTTVIVTSTVDSVPANDSIPLKPFDDPRSFNTKKVDSSLIWPVQVKEITYLSGKIFGVSITSGKGEKVKTISSGTVLSIGPYRGFGQVLFLQSKAGFIYVYGGLDGIKSRPGDVLSFGDEIGTLGSDSLSGKPRLYFMVYNKDIPVDPAKAPRGY